MPHRHKYANVARKLKKIQPMTKSILAITATLLLLSCGQKPEKTHSNISAKDNISKTISTDTILLGRLINLENIKPTHAKFKYAFVDNSAKNKRLSVPGPSDSHLEAILYFDSTTFEKIKMTYKLADYTASNFDKQSFNFEWLDKNIKIELLNSDSSYHGHPDYFFGLGQSGKLWLLDGKLLLTKSTN